MTDSTSITSQYAIQLLKAEGLHADKACKLYNMGDHKSAVNMLITGDVDAAIVSDHAIRQIPASMQEQIVVAYTCDQPLPGSVFMGNPQMDRTHLKQISKAILDFTNHTPDGIRLMRRIGDHGLSLVSPST